VSRTIPIAAVAGDTETDDDPRPLLIRVSPGLCRGWGQCHTFAREVYHLDAEGQVAFHVLEVPPEYAEIARIGASVCPEGAIQVVGPIEPR
jgi:ferredoxin